MRPCASGGAVALACLVLAHGVGAQSVAVAATAAAPEAAADSAAPGRPGGPRPEDFAAGLELRLGEPADSPAWRVPLPLEVYRGLVRGDRGDLRVFNARGEAVPHQLRRPEVVAASRPPAVVLPLFPLRGDAARALRDVRIRIESGAGAVSVDAGGGSGQAASISRYVADGRGLRAEVAALELRWPASSAQFAGRVEVEASDDLDAWRSVGGGTVANLAAGDSRLVENRIEIAPTRARYWRLGWAGAPAPFELQSVAAVPASARGEVLRATTRVAATAVPERPGEFLADLGASLPVDRVNVLLPDGNSVARVELAARDAATQPWRVVVADLPLYRLAQGGRELRNAPLEVPATTARLWRIAMRPPALSPGATPPQLEVAWPPHELWFVARGPGPWLLAFGSATVPPGEVALDAILPTAAGPDGRPQVAVAPASTGATRTLGGAARRAPPAAPFPWRAAVLWAALLLGVVVLGAMAFRLLRETARGDGPAAGP